MSVVCAAEKSIAFKQLAKFTFLTQTRGVRREKESRWLGYYKRKYATPVYLARKENYRKEILKPLEEIPSLEERLKESNAPDPVLDERIDIGYSRAKNKNVSLQDRLEWRKLCKASQKLHTNEDELVKIDLSAVKRDCLESVGLEALQNTVEHYGIFSDLYQHGYFTPQIPLTIRYDYDNEYVSPVHSGNILPASEVTKAPHVSFHSKPDDLWTLVLTNLDGHLLDTHSEYLHWFIGNIKGNNVESGEVVFDYLRPFPMRGTGYHRLVFVLYKQKNELDFSSRKRETPCLSLKERTFKTFDFYKEYQDSLTPAGLAFYQCTWDESLTDFFHHVLDMQEPVFEYIEKPLHYRPQVHFPHLEPFNKYLDRYRDPKDIKKEVFLRRLETIHPFEEEPPMPKYPCLHKPDDYKFSWQRRDMWLRRLRLGKYRDLRPHSAYPQEDNQFDYWTQA